MRLPAAYAGVAGDNDVPGTYCTDYTLYRSLALLPLPEGWKSNRERERERERKRIVEAIRIRNAETSELLELNGSISLRASS